MEIFDANLPDQKPLFQTEFREYILDCILNENQLLIYTHNLPYLQQLVKQVAGIDQYDKYWCFIKNKIPFMMNIKSAMKKPFQFEEIIALRVIKTGVVGIYYTDDIMFTINTIVNEIYTIFDQVGYPTMQVI